VDRKYRSGVENCKRAIVLLKKQNLFSEEVLSPVFYLNLGRAYVAAGKKKDAIDAFKKGLTYDDENNGLKKELQALGATGNIATWMTALNSIPCPPARYKSNSLSAASHQFRYHHHPQPLR
jgi:tetratricopeptide (TPR) repeat protein